MKPINPIPQIWCIHGTLQTPEVWDPLEGEFTLDGKVLLFQPENLWEEEPAGFWGWSKEFCNRVVLNGRGCRQVLMGYSLGGRLAFHAYLDNPELWSAVIIVSADTGFQDESYKERQLEIDRRWGERFREENSGELMAEWDALPVFCGLPNLAFREVERLEGGKIADFFDRFSKGRQDDLLPRLKGMESPPILFLSGDRDVKYGKFGRILAEKCPAITHKVIKGAGHRVPWENREGFVEEVQAFLDRHL